MVHKIKKKKKLEISHQYLGRETLGNERIDEIVFKKGDLFDWFRIFGAPNKKYAIKFAKLLFEKGYFSGYYIYNMRKLKKGD